MKKTFFLFLIFVGLVFQLFSQSPAGIANSGLSYFDNPKTINTDFGYMQINDKPYVGLRFQPELTFGKLGFGLDVPLLFNAEDGELRTEEFEDGPGYLRLISYVRWGRKKQDPLYIKVGSLQGEYLGFGMLLSSYSNSISYEKRKMGLSFDFLVTKKIGFEGIYSDFNTESFTLLGMRPYYRPFGETHIPIIRTIEFGASFVTDRDQTSPLGETATNNTLEYGMKAWGLDAGAFLLNTGFIDWTVYTQFGMLMKVKENSPNFQEGWGTEESSLILGYKSGSGFGVGTAARMNFILHIFEVTARVERYWHGDYFIPQFFDAGYEMNKDAKISSLPITSASQGIYASLAADLINQIIVGGGILLPDNVNEKHPAMLFLSLDIPRLIPRIVLSGRYFRRGIADLSDAIALDEKSQANVRIAYKIYPFLVAGVDYKWSFIPNEEGNIEIDKQIFPYIGLHIPLNY